MRISKQISREASKTAYKKLVKYIQEDKKREGKFLNYDTSLALYQGSSIKMIMICKLCAIKGLPKYFSINSHSIGKGVGCKRCAGNHTPTTKEWVVRASKTPKGKDLLFNKVEYINAETPIELICKIKNHENFYLNPIDVTRTFRPRGCPLCSLTNSITGKKTLNHYLTKKLKKKFNFKNSIYKGSSVSIKILCKEHNLYFSETPSHFSERVIGCSRCKHEAFIKKSMVKYGVTNPQQKNIHNYKKWINDNFFYNLIRSGNSLKLSSKYLAKYFNVNISTITERLRGLGLKPKLKTISTEESELRKFVESVYKGQIIYNDRIVLEGKELDIYLPELKIAIEFNGVYWHSDKIKTDKAYHKKKAR